MRRAVTLALRGGPALFALGLLVACGCRSDGSRAQAPAAGAGTTGREVATGDTLTEFQKSRLLGHYSTEDGASGFILDRTVSPWRAKLDGVGRVVTLNESNSVRGAKEYTSEDRSLWIRVETETGDVMLFQGPKQHEGVRVQRDADAERLE